MSRGKEIEGHDEELPPGKMRLDKWLWAARFFKTRSLAAAAIDSGKVDVNGERAKRARTIGAGDQISLRIGAVDWKLDVLDVAKQRGSAEIARRLYQETSEGLAARLKKQEELRQSPQLSSFGEARPDKHDRRQLKRLKGDY